MPSQESKSGLIGAAAARDAARVRFEESAASFRTRALDSQQNLERGTRRWTELASSRSMLRRLESSLPS